jgi:hypothetical protein
MLAPLSSLLATAAKLAALLFQSRRWKGQAKPCMSLMSSKERVLAALKFEKPDRVPIYDSFWEEFVEAWRREKGLPNEADIADYYGLDLVVVVPDETPFPNQQGVLEATRDHQIVRTGWGAMERTVSGASSVRCSRSPWRKGRPLIAWPSSYRSLSGATRPWRR